MIISAFGSSGCPRAEEHKDSASVGAMQPAQEQLRRCEAAVRFVTKWIEIKQEALKTLQDELETEQAAFSRLMNEKVQILKQIAQEQESHKPPGHIRVRRLIKRKKH